MQRRTYLKTMLGGATALAAPGKASVIVKHACDCAPEASALTMPAAAEMYDALAGRIKHTDPSKYHEAHSHGAAGIIACQHPSLLVSTDVTTNLFFVDRCLILPGGGVAHHFHDHCEEMFIIFDGEAQFTIDGRTSSLKGPAGAPCRMGHSHAIYNHTDKPVQFMNINVTAVKGKYDAFNLSDSRIGVPLDPIPIFRTMRLYRSLLHPDEYPAGGPPRPNQGGPVENYLGGHGTVYYRRALHPEVFLTNWSYVDHLVLPPGTSEGRHLHAGVEEVYYVMNGSGKAQVDEETATIQHGDAVPVRLSEVHAFSNNGSEDLELMIIGVAAQKWVLNAMP